MSLKAIRSNRAGTRRATSRVRLFLLPLTLVVAGGCSQLIDPRAPEPVQRFVEPGLGRQYLLYRPSSYDRALAWPLVVACHAAFPDSPKRQIRHWTELAESHGFVVAVPTSEAVRGNWSSDPSSRIARLREDQRHILGIVQHVRAGHNISHDRIFLHGACEGALDALYTGLRHPEVFRAITLAEPKFDDELLADARGLIDRHQPVSIHYSISDVITGKHARRCIDWLLTQNAAVHEDTAGAVRRGDCRWAVDFYEHVLRTVSLLQIRAFPSEQDTHHRIQFKLRSSFGVSRVRWEFGDGGVSTEREPAHSYQGPGTYMVTLIVNDPAGRMHERTRNVRVN